MRRHLRRWINDAALVRLGGSYEGVVTSVTEEHVRNRFTAMRQAGDRIRRHQQFYVQVPESPSGEDDAGRR